ncbi:MAG: polysaccharide biosynthesis/export family protein, partial [Verrucomicrobia bacterium]|nr:polysaccharide biosynthesis/export family protein [Verrucomicrobiota bacterium]
MNFLRRIVAPFARGLAAGLLRLAGAGCGTLGDAEPPAPATPHDNTTEIIRAGDKLIVTLSDSPMGPFLFEKTVSEDGKITIHQNQEFTAADKTPSELEKEIHARYVPK